MIFHDTPTPSRGIDYADGGIASLGLELALDGARLTGVG